MKIARLIALLSILVGSSSCAFFNGRTVDLAINSNPPGANIFIEGRSYGVTPTVINIEPKKYLVTLTKEGYGSAVFNTDTWGTIRTNVSGDTTADGTRCLLDTVSVLFFFNVFTQKCADFKQKEYFINIPRTGATASNSASMIGLGNRPSNAIDYYYDQQQAAPPANQGMMRQGSNPYQMQYQAQ